MFASIWLYWTVQEHVLCQTWMSATIKELLNHLTDSLVQFMEMIRNCYNVACFPFCPSHLAFIMIHDSPSLPASQYKHSVNQDLRSLGSFRSACTKCVIRPLQRYSGIVVNRKQGCDTCQQLQRREVIFVRAGGLIQRDVDKWAERKLERKHFDSDSCVCSLKDTLDSSDCLEQKITDYKV